LAPFRIWLIGNIVRTMFFHRLRVKRRQILVRYFGAIAENENPYYWKHCVGMAACICAVAKGIQMYRKFALVEATSEAHTFFRKPSSEDEKLNDLEEKMDCGRHVIRTKQESKFNYNVVQHVDRRSTFDGTIEGMYKTIGCNSLEVRVFSKDGRLNIRTCILGVQGTCALINEHAFAHESVVDIRIYTKREPEETDAFFLIEVQRSDCVRVAQDVLLFDTVKRNFRNIVQHFINGSMTHLMGSIKGHSTRVYFKTDLITVKDEHVGKFNVTDYLMYDFPQHQRGDCGLPLLVEVDRHGVAIAGIHFSGGDKTTEGFAMYLNQAMLTKGLRLLHEKSPIVEVYSQGFVDMHLEDPMRKSCFVHESYPYINYYGFTGEKVMIKKKSKLEPTPYCNDVDALLFREFGFKPSVCFGRPMMMPTIVEGEYISPLNIGLRKMDNDAPPLDMKILRKCIDVYFNRICSRIEINSPISPLTIEEAINGILDDPYIRRINTSTSAAYGYPGKKHEYLLMVQENPLIREPIEDLRIELNEHVRKYLAKEMVHPFTSVQLKDEPRELSKCASGKTRLFYMSQLVYLVVCRMMLAQFYSRMVEFSDAFCVAVGISMYSDAGKLVTKLSRHSKFLEGDYGGFDVSSSIYIARAANTLIYEVLEQWGYNPYALAVLKGVLSDSVFPMIVMNGDVFMKPGLQPSGKYGTAEDNSLRGVLMLLYAWYSNPELEGKNFFHYCEPVVYGDDVVCGLDDEICEVFNNITYSNDCLQYYGMEFTNAQKTKDFEKYLHIWDISFLKRKFEMSELWDDYVAPLDMNSIAKSLSWIMPSDTVTREEQCVSALTSMLWEVFLHCESKMQYSRVKMCFEQWLYDYFELSPLDSKLPDFDNVAQGMGYYRVHEHWSDCEQKYGDLEWV